LVDKTEQKNEVRIMKKIGSTDEGSLSVPIQPNAFAGLTASSLPNS